MPTDVMHGLGAVLEIILNMLQVMVIASVLVNLLGADHNNQIVRLISAFTEPVYRPIRKLTSRIPGPMDWAPFVVLMIIVFVQIAFVRPMMRGG